MVEYISIEDDFHQEVKDTELEFIPNITTVAQLFDLQEVAI